MNPTGIFRAAFFAMGQGGVEAKFAVQGHGQNRIKLFRWGPPFLRPGCMPEIQAVTKEPNCENEKNVIKYLPLTVDDHCRGWVVLSKLSTMSKKSMGISWILPWTNHYDQLNCYIPLPLPLLCHLMCGGGSLGSHSHTVNGLNKPEPARGADAFCASQKEHFAAISFFFLLLLNLHLTEKNILHFLPKS